MHHLSCLSVDKVIWDKIGESKFLKGRFKGLCFDRGMLWIFKIGDLELCRFKLTMGEERDYFE